MDKTIHSRLTEKHHYQATILEYAYGEEGFNGLAHEMALLREAARDLMQPRPQAVSRLLQMAREM
jgi:hypothetical protein